MATQPITYLNIEKRIPYATPADVQLLIGSVINAANVSQDQVLQEIKDGSKYIEKKCNTKFYPRRERFRQDGNGGQVMMVQKTPVINVNQLEIYTWNLLGLRRVLYDYQLVVDAKTGTLAYPLTNNITLAPITSFYVGTQNIILDLHVGHTEEIYDETMDNPSGDLKNYTFDNDYVVQYTEMPGPNDAQAPLISPCIYVNGVYQKNTTYVWDNTQVYNSILNGALLEPYAQYTWGIAADNLIYTLNETEYGITGITFNNPLPPGSVVTATYKNAVIPTDITEAVAKHAAINVLRAVATGIYSDLQFMGADQIQDNNARIIANNGRWESQIAGWTQDIKEIVVANKSTLPGIVGNNINNPYLGARWHDSFNRL